MSDVGNSEATEVASGQSAGPVDVPAEVTPVVAAVDVPATQAATEPTTEAVEPPADEPAPVDDDAFAESPVVHKHFTAPAMIPLDRLSDDLQFLVRAEAELEDVSSLATDLARLGQLFPIDVRLQPPDRFQVITGFRRVAALRFLQREKVLARLHTDLPDADATLMALASAIHSKSVSAEALIAVRERLASEGHLTAAARDMFEKALATESSLAPELAEEEVDADELAGDVTVRLGECNQDLSLLADVFDQLDDEKKDELLRQLRYSAELVTFLEGKR
jgi:ParB-like chromosome segregation protein Spo0J